jgi:hypothetical protein
LSLLIITTPLGGLDWSSYGIVADDLILANQDKHADEATLAALVALQQSYPELIKNITYHEHDWVLNFFSGQQLYWSMGRLLPASMRHLSKSYRAYISYPYPASTPDPQTFSEADIAKIKSYGSQKNRANAPVYEGSVYDEIYSSDSRLHLEQQLETVSFLGQDLQVHCYVAAKVRYIDKRIKDMAQNDAEIANFLQSLNSITSYVWRSMRGTSSLSFHALGVAIDVLPTDRSKILYWGWERVNNDKWMTVPLSKRWDPPEAIIKIFEEQGFIWGGRWALYDNMHFEYRPELLWLQIYYEQHKE